MTKGDLMVAWKGIPSNAEIVVEADHGQTPSFVYGIEVSQEDPSDGDLDDIRWKTVTSKTKVKRITAILIR